MGSLLDLRLEYIDQNRRRSGLHAGGGAQDHDELYTLNRNAMLNARSRLRAEVGG